MELVVIGEYYIDRVELSRRYDLNEKQTNKLCDKIDYYELTDTDLSRINSMMGVKQFIESEVHITEKFKSTPMNIRLLTRSKFLELTNGNTLIIL